MVEPYHQALLQRLQTINSMGDSANSYAAQAAAAPSYAGSGAYAGSSFTPDFSNTGAGGRRQAVINYASQFLGTPYQWGGTSPKSGFDCSGLTQFVYGRYGIKLPRVASDQASMGRHVALSSLSPGDMVGWNENGSIGHIAIYLGGGRILEAPHTGSRVRIRSLGNGGFDSGAFGIHLNY